MPLDKTDIHKILVVKLRNIGDVLLTSPVFANLREHFPSARICAFVNRGTEAMLTDNPNIDKLYVYDRDLKKAPFLQRSVAELSLMKRVRSEGFDMVLNLTEGDRGALVALASGAKIKVGVDSRRRGFRGKNRIFTHLLPPPDRETHAVDQNLAALMLLGLEVRHKKVEFHFPEDVRAGMTARLAANDLKPYGFYHAHVTSRWMFKTLPPEKMAALLDFMTAETGLPAVLEAAPGGEGTILPRAGSRLMPVSAHKSRRCSAQGSRRAFRHVQFFCRRRFGAHAYRRSRGRTGAWSLRPLAGAQLGAVGQSADGKSVPGTPGDPEHRP